MAKCFILGKFQRVLGCRTSKPNHRHQNMLDQTQFLRFSYSLCLAWTWTRDLQTLYGVVDWSYSGSSLPWNTLKEQNASENWLPKFAKLFQGQKKWNFESVEPINFFLLLSKANRVPQLLQKLNHLVGSCKAAAAAAQWRRQRQRRRWQRRRLPLLLLAALWGL